MDVFDQVDKGIKLPPSPIILNGISFGMPAPLYDSQEAAYRAMLAEFAEGIADLEAEGVRVSMKDFTRQADLLWNCVWKHFAK
jgi:hypothetical protein